VQEQRGAKRDEQASGYSDDREDQRVDEGSAKCRITCQINEVGQPHPSGRSDEVVVRERHRDGHA
jgi:hypothetical protein